MSPITHFLVGWTLAERFTKTPLARCLVTLASVVPDLDGLGVVVDLVNRGLGRPESDWFGTLHHMLLHGGFGAMLAVGGACLLGLRDRQSLLLVLVSFHLHLGCDFFGSRGPTPSEIWPIHYLAPFSQRWTVSFSHQWALNAWQNILFTATLIVGVVTRATIVGISPVSIFSRRWDTVVVQTLRARFGKAC